MDVLTIDQATLERLDLRKATHDEGTGPASLLPPSIADAVLEARADEVSQHLAAQFEEGLSVHQPEVVLAAKARGRRPVAVLSTGERVLYRALTETLRPLLPPVVRGSDKYEVFKAAPLEDPDANFIVMTDIAACYQYIDHGLLQRELVGQTGEPRLSRALIKFLQIVAGRRFGLPQNRAASDVVAEAVLSLVQRRATRRGARLWRYSDDFRIVGSTRSEAHTALETLEHELRKVGLVINDEKTSVMTRERYEVWASAVQARMDEVEAEVEIDLTTFSEYDEDEEEPEDAEVKAQAAAKILEHWAEQTAASDEPRFGPNALVDRKLASTALSILTAASESAGLDICVQLLEAEPSLTPNIARYLASLMKDCEDDVDQVLDAIMSKDQYTSSWQALWLCRPLLRSSGLTTTQSEWLEDQKSADLHLLRASIAEVLASHGLVSSDDLLLEFESAPLGARPRWVTAIAQAVEDADDSSIGAVTEGRPFYQWVAEATYGD